MVFPMICGNGSILAGIVTGSFGSASADQKPPSQDGGRLRADSRTSHQPRGVFNRSIGQNWVPSGKQT